MSDPAAELVFYTNPQSRGRTVRWMLEEVGQPYRTEIVAYGPAMKSPAYLAINPMAKVPALTHGDAVVTETGAIIAYLADAFPQAGLAPPPGDPARGAYLRWLFFGAGPLESAWTNQSFGFILPEDAQARSGYGSFDRVLGALEVTLEAAPYLAGDRFSAADIYVGAQIGFGVHFKMFEPRPVFDAYLGRIMSRPAFARSRDMDEALMKAG